MSQHECDVAIVGAGLAGLTAARYLRARNLEVVVLEAQDRVGGRTLSEDVGNGVVVDHGGQWVSPGQPEIDILAGELGVESLARATVGRTVHWRDGRRTTADGPMTDAVAEDAVRAGARALTALASRVPPQAPWDAPEAEQLDALSFRAWLELNVASPAARRAVSRLIGGAPSGGPGRTSLLAVLAVIGSGEGGLARLASAQDLGPERSFVGGAQRLCDRIASQLGLRVIRNAWVNEIEHGSHGVAIRGSGVTARSRVVVVALPPALAARIRYRPPLSAQRDHLSQRSPMASVLKVHCVYPERFWAEDGLSGSVVSDEGAVRDTADSSPPHGRPGVLAAMVHGRRADRLAEVTPIERRSIVLRDLERYFGRSAARPVVYVEKSWGDDEFARGAYGCFWPPGVLTAVGRSLRPRVGPIVWAGAESSASWIGKLEGAVASGRAAADAVLERMA